MEFQNFGNVLDTTSDDKDLPRFAAKNGLKSMINQEEITILIKKLELKHQCSDQIYVIILIYCCERRYYS